MAFALVAARGGRLRGPANIPAAVRNAFFRTAASVLLGPAPEPDLTTAGRAGTYVVIARMLPTQNFSVENFDLNGLFTALAQEDFNRAADLPKGFTGESPRAVAMLAVARTDA